jgi:hypothetical protein
MDTNEVYEIRWTKMDDVLMVTEYFLERRLQKRNKARRNSADEKISTLLKYAQPAQKLEKVQFKLLN